jgi:hypothetical protein
MALLSGAQLKLGRDFVYLSTSSTFWLIYVLSGLGLNDENIGCLFFC